MQPVTAPLFRESIRTVVYPKELAIPLPRQAPGRGFFPGCSGLFSSDARDLPEFPFDGVMIVGQDFDSVEAYGEGPQVGEDLSLPTWRNLLPLLRDAEIEPAACFFTNAYQGLRTGQRNTGWTRATADSAYVSTCRDFFAVQLRFAKPRLVIALGGAVANFLAQCSASIPAEWRKGAFGPIDEAGRALIRDADFSGYGVVPASVVLLHPSFRAPNVWRRRYGTSHGHEAEVRLLKDAAAPL